MRTVAQCLKPQYTKMLFLASLISVLSIGMLAIEMFRDDRRFTSEVSKGLFCSTLMTAVISCVIFMMLGFYSQGLGSEQSLKP